MKISLKHQAIERKKSEVCAVIDHRIDDEMIDFAIAKIAGRYPDIKQVTNQKCKEIVYINEVFLKQNQFVREAYSD